MGIPILILGESGSGKSCSLRNFEKDEVAIYNIAGKPLPFKKQLNKADNVTYTQIKSNMQKGTFKTYVIDDSQYLMAFEMFDRAKEVGYNKFTDVALNFRSLVDFVIKCTPADTIVYFLHHTETTDTGKIKAKTSGKMLDNQLTLEGLFSIVLLCKTDGQEHYFETQSDGYSTCKSPMGMFELKIDNDLKMVDTTIREYYELNKTTKKGEKEDAKLDLDSELLKPMRDQFEIVLNRLVGIVATQNKEAEIVLKINLDSSKQFEEVDEETVKEWVEPRIDYSISEKIKEVKNTNKGLVGFDYQVKIDEETNQTYVEKINEQTSLFKGGK